ncbi:MAG: hypothetical protein Q4C75_03540, partial [Bergeyella zoohelcum]|nr:hypothetical protein [Bergeyella zoohelcum]
MKNIYIALFALFAGVTINAQVGIKNDVEDPTVSSNTTGYTYPATSATLDTYFSKRGVLVPEYDLKVLDDSTTPVDFTADKVAGKVVDGTMIFNNGNSNTYPRGYYIWVTDRWVYILNKSSVPVQMTLSVLGDNIIIPATAGTNVNYVSK